MWVQRRAAISRNLRKSLDKGFTIALTTGIDVVGEQVIVGDQMAFVGLVPNIADILDQFALVVNQGVELCDNQTRQILSEWTRDGSFGKRSPNYSSSSSTCCSVTIVGNRSSEVQLITGQIIYWSVLPRKSQKFRCKEFCSMTSQSHLYPVNVTLYRDNRKGNLFGLWKESILVTWMCETRKNHCIHT